MLELDNFQQVNLITGRNNCGKTTVLEALFLISGISNPRLLMTINNDRGLVIQSNDDFNSIFHNLDFEQEPHIAVMLDDYPRTLTVKPKYTAENNEEIISTEKINLAAENKTMLNADSFPSVDKIIFEFNDGKDMGNLRSEISLDGNEVAIGIPNLYREKLLCAFYPSRNPMTMLPRQIEKLLINKLLDGVIETLREIDPRIAGIGLGSGGAIYVDIGLNKFLPINIMGDGIRKTLAIIAAISAVQGGILLIDEIENGLHYSSLTILWKAVLKALEVYNVQLFATTHSNECIAALDHSHKAAKEKADNISLYRIEHYNNSHRAFQYSSNVIAAGIDNNIEMR